MIQDNQKIDKTLLRFNKYNALKRLEGISFQEVSKRILKYLLKIYHQEKMIM